MILFLIQFVLTNIIFSIIICGLLIRLDRQRTYSPFELLLYSLGLGPIFTTLSIYYFLLFIPFRSNLFYFLAVIVIYLTGLIFGREGFPILWLNLRRRIKIKNVKKKFHLATVPQKIESVVFLSAVILIIGIIFFFFLPNIISMPITGTDSLKYGNIGKIIFNEKSLAYRWINPYPNTGYYFRTNHAPSFPLLLTWDKIVCSFFDVDQDLYYKSIIPWYSLLLVGLFLFWISKQSRYLALLGVWTFLAGLSFPHSFVSGHIDLFRTFFLVLSWIFLAYAIKKKNKVSFLLLGIFSGFSAFSHTIGAVLVVLNCLALFIFLEGRLKYKLIKTINVIVLTIVFGWFHYIIDVIWGNGWIIFYRYITYWG